MRNFINMITESAVSLNFSTSEDCWEFEGFGVYASMMGHQDQTMPTSVSIYEFTSTNSGSGNGEKALRWLRDNGVEFIGVDDPGDPEENPESWGFWSAMCEKGLIDQMADEDGDIIYKK